ncbi:hypothetical protein GCM10025867_51590 (plasmid) [Frondihabitans sucicola]|uniref:DNA-binding protein n=1 Tax=Frondihabitans sucicola TaxID=1268041 RepID=A0ABM8GV56_9MICO|nr:hypothetical protein [Frondihabitans sucicola]BDZ52351.1 hypothetical protein GCM10025867_45920 [Frondihabitans sucicola]BDZ52918.1 hypothetical protein GCM10025867_51590 [Frondihabitans sucicola]
MTEARLGDGFRHIAGTVTEAAEALDDVTYFDIVLADGRPVNCLYPNDPIDDLAPRLIEGAAVTIRGELSSYTEVDPPLLSIAAFPEAILLERT